MAKRMLNEIPQQGGGMDLSRHWGHSVARTRSWHVMGCISTRCTAAGCRAAVCVCSIVWRCLRSRRRAAQLSLVRGIPGIQPNLRPALQLRYTERVKTATIPSVRVEPDFRAEVEAVLADGETLSEFVEASIRANVERRRVQAEFIARGLRSRDEARRTGEYVDADVVLEGLQRKLDAARARLPKKRK